MAKIDFAFWDAVSHADEGAVMADVYDDHIRLAQRAEELGWHSYFTIEHQNSPVCEVPLLNLSLVEKFPVPCQVRTLLTSDTRANVTTNVPTGSARATGYGTHFMKSVGTTARNADLDYMEVSGYFPGKR